MKIVLIAVGTTSLAVTVYASAWGHGMIEHLPGYIGIVLFSGLIYAMCAVCMQSIGSAAVVAAVLPFRWRSGWRWFTAFVQNLTLFNMLLLIFGVLANSAWMLLVYDHLYSAPDMLFGFFPYVPFGDWALDNGNEIVGWRGEVLAGTSMLTLRGLWLLYSATVWTLTVVTYRALGKQRRSAGPCVAA